MQPLWRVHLVSALVACVVAAATAFVTVRLIAPVRERPTDPTPSAPGKPSTVILEGVEDMPLGRKAEVFYKAPFAAPPHLTFPDGLQGYSCEVEEQKAESFVLRRAGVIAYGDPSVAKVKWKAEGQPAK
jgi:hypothetical protein